MDSHVTRKFTPVPFTNVAIEDVFWAPRIRANRENSIPHGYNQCKETGRIDAFKLNWKPGMEPVPHVFWDSDVAKWVEAASYSLAGHPDPELEARLDEVVKLIVSAQQPDGYINVHFTVVEPEKRWANLRDLHELYCAGHLIEAAVAYYQATGKRNLLDAVSRYANYIATVFGTEPDKKRGYCGHEEIELALVKLYHATGEKRYLELARYFVEERGRKPHYFDEEAKARGEAPDNYIGGDYRYCQAQAPVREHTVVEGHAVRAMYLYSAVADLAGELGDSELRAVGERLWNQLTSKRMYITGGIGSTSANEGFTFDYDLPNETAYAETCAAIGLVMWCHRLLQLDCDSRYADVMERALYNGVLSGVSQDGTRFFYENPLASLGNHHRQEWFGCACCPTNMVRLLASLGQYVYSQSDTDAVIHLYVQGSGKLDIHGTPVTLHQDTNYPWDGRVQIRVETAKPATFGLRLRIPNWCRDAKLMLNGEPVQNAHMDKGYLRVEREWTNGDRIELGLPMPVERMRAHPDVRQDVGKVALQRGPLVYCLEQADNPDPLHRLVIPEGAEFAAIYEKNLLDGVMILTGEAEALDTEDWGSELHRPYPPRTRPSRITAIPYYAWDSREPGAMQVWTDEG